MRNMHTGEALKEKKNIELLAPAGSYEGFEAALGAGADAVYAGGTRFGARAYAANFSDEELLRAIRVSHIHGKKFYLTVKTLLKDQEFGELGEYLRPLYEAGLDAVIVQDFGVLRFIRRSFPGLDIHASTQMTVTGPEGMRFLMEQGVTRVVPARELSLSELKAMHRACPIELEVFIHGALCCSYSGQCLMSSLLGGRSGNRGRCAQPCRLPYRTAGEPGGFRSGKERFPLSLKDLCAIELLPEILEAGAVSLKIEGRMKQPSYTAGVTAIYRKYLDLLLREGPQRYRVSREDKERLLEVYSRGGSCSGYYLRHNGPEMTAFSSEKKTGDVSVEIIKRKEKIYGRFMLFSGRPAILELSCRDARVTVCAGEAAAAVSRPLTPEQVRLQMDRLGNTEFEWGGLDIQMEESLFLPVKTLNELRREGLERLEEELLRKYGRRPEETESCIGKGSTGKELSPGTESRTAELSEEGRAPISGGPKEKKEDTSLPGRPLYVSCETALQAEALRDREEIRGMYLPFDVMEDFLSSGAAEKKELYLSLPHIHRGEAPRGYFERAREWLDRGMRGFLVRSLESYAVLRRMGLSRFCVLDASIYTWNREACAFWREEGILRDTVPLELNEKELRVRDNGNSELLIYGRLPVMVTAQCQKKNSSGCSGREELMWLQDRYHKLFPSLCRCRPWKEKTTEKQEKCYNIIYNSLPFGLLNENRQAGALGVRSFRLSFTLESPSETRQITDRFLAVYGPPGERGDSASGGKAGRTDFPGELTRGHFKRGVL